MCGTFFWNTRLRKSTHILTDSVYRSLADMMATFSVGYIQLTS